MINNFRYAFLTSTVAYIIIAVVFVIIGGVGQGWDEYAGTTIVAGITLGLSEFGWWGDFYYLAVIVPWAGSTLVTALLMLRLNSRTGSRYLAGALGVFIYYIAMFLVYIGGGLAHGWGDIGYAFLPAWAVLGAVVGYIAAAVAEAALKP